MANTDLISSIFNLAALRQQANELKAEEKAYKRALKR
jgi:hypothetical protein